MTLFGFQGWLARPCSIEGRGMGTIEQAAHGTLFTCISLKDDYRNGNSENLNLGRRILWKRRLFADARDV